MLAICAIWTFSIRGSKFLCARIILKLNNQVGRRKIGPGRLGIRWFGFFILGGSSDTKNDTKKGSCLNTFADCSNCRSDYGQYPL
jgi:hypothetical protein